MNILILCDSIVRCGGLLRFDRVAKIIKDWGYKLYFLPLSSFNNKDILVNSEIISQEEAMRTRWDVTMVPGAGFPDNTIRQFENFTSNRFGLRIQHILNDTTLKERFLKVNRVFKPDLVLFNNYDWKIGTYTEFQAKQFRYLVGGVDTKTFYPLPFKKIKNKTELIVIGGQARKNPVPLIETLEYLPPNFIIKLFGNYDRNLLIKYRKYIEKERLFFIGELDERRLLKYYREIDVAVSTEKFAGWSNLGAEALSSGVPLICTKHGTSSYAIDGLTALVLEEPTPKIIASKILSLFQDHELYRKLAINGREKILEFDWYEYSTKLCKLFHKKYSQHYIYAPRFGLYGKWSIKSRLNGLREILKIAHGKTVLDMGMAEGIVALSFLRHGAKFVLGFEIDNRRVEKSKEICSAYSNKSFNAENLELWDDIKIKYKNIIKDGFDIVLYLGIHHHLDRNSRVKVLKETVKLAKFYFIIRTPAGFYKEDKIDEIMDRESFLLEKEELPQIESIGVLRIYKKLIGVNKMKREFISYPKSGRTWIRYILAQLGLEKYINFHHDQFEFNDGSKPPHNFDIELRRQKYKKTDKIVYLERDPRDVMVSLYFQVTGRFKDIFNYKGTISEFICDKYFGAYNLCKFREMWNQLVKENNYLKITYEECHENMQKVIEKIIDYYGFCVDKKRVKEAVVNATFEKMRKLEESGKFPEPWLRPRQGALKVRRGVVHGYKDYLSKEDIDFLNSIFFSNKENNISQMSIYSNYSMKQDKIEKIKKSIIVLGMHRSGTSMTAGVLHRLGVNMGKNLMKGNWANPLGYFENLEFVRLNDRILQAAGGSWNDPPGREKILAQKEKFSSEIYNLIQKEKSEIWGWKDPRTTLTIELFLPYLENPYFLICYRNPLSIAESLKRRDGTSIEFGLKLTGIYNQRIVDFLEKHPHLKKIYLPYEDIVSYPELWLKKLVNFLGLNPTNEEFQKALEFIKPKYKNTNFTFINTRSPRVSIIIPVFNKLEFTKQCLDALYEVTPINLFELIIVNNASTDGTKEFLNEFAKTHPNVKVIHNQENLGFAKACNQGARAAKGKYLVFLNNDTIPLKDWLEEMLKIIETEKNIGIVGSKLLYPNNTIQHAGVAIADFLQFICPYHIHRKSPADTPEVNVVKDYQAVTGACMLIPKELFDGLGGFDEGFLNGYEDVDLCFQVREAGYRVVYTPKSVLYHFESISEGRFKAEKENEKRLQEKWSGKIKPDVEIYFPKVSVIILNYNNSQDTIKCLESIYKNIKYKRIQGIVIDNGSKTEDVLILKKWFNSQDVESIFCHKGHFSYNNEPFKRELIFIENQENLGFAGGNNIGIKYALNCGADYVWLLNNDTIIDKDALIELIKLAEIDKKIGMVSSKLYCYHDPKKVQYNGEKVVYEGMEDVKGELPKPTNSATGCSLLMRRKLIENVGLLDEDYFLYFEDNDISTRALKAGWKVYYNPYSKVYHKGGASVGGWLKTPLSVYYATRNLLLYCYKHDGSKISEIFGSLKCQIFPQLNGDRKKIYAFSQGIEDFIFKKKGKTDIDFGNILEVIKKIERKKSEIEESLKNSFEIGTKEKFYLIKNAFILKSDEYLNKFFNLARVLFLKESYKKDKKEVDYYHQAEVLYNNGQERSHKII
ncbi:MAG TPA: glycosyltransferase [Candidatus Desulfofervidus auxilii]|uniref:Glycosyltransferase n=1 Tax=Desulfofervidus auxilii TaxID=1621989 RepID=A0A7C2A962_DESA2|nr:glycosyltransferase [Candidatus Desulfofervidus auxilii]